MTTQQINRLTLEAFFARLVCDGGFTADIRNNTWAPSDGFALSLSKDSEVCAPISKPGLVKAVIREYVKAYAEDLSRPDNYLGGWVSDGKVYLDVSTIVPTLERALFLATKANQIAVYDLAQGLSIYVADALQAA